MTAGASASSTVSSTAAATVLTAEGLTLGYGRRVILRDVNFEVRAGEFWFILGPNGEGKSTLLRALLGGLRASVGRVAFGANYAAREATGFVPQRCDLNPSMPTTVREFVKLGLVGTSVRRDDSDARLKVALARSGLAGMDHRNYWSLSGGQRQRALVARALIRRPRLIIVDEPTNGLDVAAEDALLRALSDLNRDEGLTVMFVTHELDIAARYATHAAIVCRGTVTAGTTAAVLTAENLARAYAAPVAFFRELAHLPGGAPR